LKIFIFGPDPPSSNIRAFVYLRKSFTNGKIKKMENSKYIIYIETLTYIYMKSEHWGLNIITVALVVDIYLLLRSLHLITDKDEFERKPNNKMKYIQNNGNRTTSYKYVI
jgi:hypothetical protein